MSWYARTGPRKKETGKFRSYAQTGIEKSTGEPYRGWSFSFVTHQTGSSVRRKRYAVAICDPHKNRAAYLRDFSSLQQATTAAKAWIDQTLSLKLAESNSGALGTIPALPEVALPEVSASEPRPLGSRSVGLRSLCERQMRR